MNTCLWGPALNSCLPQLVDTPAGKRSVGLIPGRPRGLRCTSVRGQQNCSSQTTVCSDHGQGSRCQGGVRSRRQGRHRRNLSHSAKSQPGGARGQAATAKIFQDILNKHSSKTHTHTFLDGHQSTRGPSLCPEGLTLLSLTAPDPHFASTWKGAPPRNRRMKSLRFRVWINGTAESIYTKTKDTIRTGCSYYQYTREEN